MLEEGLNQRTMELKQYLESLTALTETVDGNSKQLEQMHTMQAGMNTTVRRTSVASIVSCRDGSLSVRVLLGLHRPCVLAAVPYCGLL